jgi:hypothetical protein
MRYTTMINYLALSNKGESMSFKAENDYEARHYVINYADHSQQWYIRTVEQFIQGVK